MAFEPKDNTGSIFANDRKESANHPDGKGTALIGGVEYWVSSWNKKTQEGKSWRSLSFTPKEKQSAPAPQKAFKPASADAFKSRQLARESYPPQEDFDSPPF